MSYQITPIDLSVIAVGKSGQISFNSVRNKIARDPLHATEPAHLRLFNESGSTLLIASDDWSIQDTVPAGAWPTYEIGQSVSLINFTVDSVLPNPPIQKLYPVFYAPGEQVPDTPQLGNSPIGGGVSTTSIQTLSNETSPATPVLVIDIGNTTLSNLINIFNDGTLNWKVLVSGVAHTVFTIERFGNALLLGQVGDTVEVLGGLAVDDMAQIGGRTVNKSGTTTGAVNLIQILSSINKYVIVEISANYNSAQQDLAIPVPFLEQAQIRANGNMAPISLMASGLAQNINVVSAISATTGAETTVNTTTPPSGSGWRGRCGTAFDTVRMLATGAVGAAWIIMEGK